MKYFLFIACCAFNSICFSAEQWTALPSDEAIQFTASYDDIEFNGIFREFTSSAIIDPHNIDSSFIRSTVDVTSIDTQSHDRDQALAESDWFFFSRFPDASFSSTKLSHVKANRYQVTGILKIRDQEKQISFPLDWQVLDNGHARAIAQFELDRRDFNIGIGDWAEDETIGFNVKVNISIDYEEELSSDSN